MKISIIIDDKLISDVLKGAHSRYWARDLVWNGKSGHVTEHGDEGLNIKHRLNRKNIREGLALMATAAPQGFAALLSEDYDGITGDCLLQCAVLGELKYG